MRAKNGLVRVFWRGVVEQQSLQHPPGPFSPDPGRGCASAPGGIPLPPDQIVVRFSEDRKGGAMASDITLAVGDGACRMTYNELAQTRGVPLASARIVPRAISRNSAETPDSSDPGPAGTGS